MVAKLIIKDANVITMTRPTDTGDAQAIAIGEDRILAVGNNQEMDSLMGRVYGEGEIRVNSVHHMAVDEVAPGFAVTARCPDGVVEAIESTEDDWFALGTQFHPQSDSASALDLRIFEEFVAGIAGRVVEMPMVA